MQAEDNKIINAERREVLQRVEDALETPMLILGLVWLVLLVIELTREPTPPLVEFLSVAIWVVFIIDFAVKFLLAPEKVNYLKHNVLTVIALVIPALRVFRIFRAVRVLRAARAARGVRLVRVITSLNRGMRALGATMSRRGFGYVLALTAIVTLAGAAGMYAFERGNPDGRGLHSYGHALWWTAMIMTTFGSEYWPQSPEGRLLCFLLSVYALAVFGYITATIATFFIDRDAESPESPVPSAHSIEQLHAELRALRELLETKRPTA